MAMKYGNEQEPTIATASDYYVILCVTSERLSAGRLVFPDELSPGAGVRGPPLPLL